MAKQTNGEPENEWPAGVGKPAQRALAGAGFTRLEQLAGVSEAELKKLHGMLGLLRQALEAKGLSFANPR
jgi:predicted flap endonuclease-1-like 5' DNA nuclease